MDFSLPATQPADQKQVCSASEDLASITWLQLLIYTQFLIAATISIFATVGVAIGWPVSTLFLLALLQFVIALPGCIYNTQQQPLFLIIYIALQLVTGLSELIWFIAHLVQAGGWPSAVGLGILFPVQILSIVVAIFWRDVTVIRRPKQDLETHLTHPVETTSVSTYTEVEESEKRFPSRKEFNESEISSCRSSRRSKKSMKNPYEVSFRTFSTKKTTPTTKVAPTMISGHKKIEEVKKMIAEMNAKDESRRKKSGLPVATIASNQLTSTIPESKPVV